MQQILLLLCVSLLFVACDKDASKSVTVYVSEDQVFSEPILKDFEKKTGIKVNAIYDTEESKSTGVMNRLLAEKNNPQADVYWANEPIRAEVLRHKGILTPYQSPQAKDIPSRFKNEAYFWTGFSARVRVLVAQKNLADKPHSLVDYTNTKYKAKAVIANLLFGSTTAHIAALFTLWGDEKTKQFLTQAKANQVAISTSNGESADFVASGSYDFALVDSDDAVSRIKEKKSITMIYPDQGKNEIGAFVIPNAVMLIDKSPHPKLGKKLIDYLLSKETESKLAFAACAQIPLHQGVAMPKELKPINQIKTMPVDFAKVADKMVEIQPYLKEWLSTK